MPRRRRRVPFALAGLAPALAVLGLVASAWPAAAVPLDAVESGDFPSNNATSLYLGVLDAGVNRVQGRGDGPGGDLADFWHADLPAGLEITGVEIAISNLQGSPWRAIVEDDIVGTGFGTVQAWLSGSTEGLQSVPTIQGSYPFGPGTWYFDAVTFGMSSYDYEWRVEVAVPEPSVGLLLGLAALVRLRRSRGGRAARNERAG